MISAGGCVRNVRKWIDPNIGTLTLIKWRFKMKKVLTGIMLATCMIFGATLMAQAATLEEAKALAEKGAAYVKANGKDKAIAEINNPNGEFVKGDLYLFLQDFNGVILAHGGNPKLVGQNHFEVKDPTGKFFVKEMIEILKSKGSGWIEYSWTNPATKKVQPKKTWVQKVEGTDMYVGCGIFQ
jgi:cytochrome c